MSTAALLSVWLLPLLMAALPGRLLRPWLSPLAAAAALLCLPLLQTGQQLSLDWLLLGMHLAWDDTAFWFLLAGAILWLFAGLQQWLSDDTRVQRLFLSAMAGNFLLIVAGDGLSFYVGYALMGLSAYGLLLGRRGPKARRAGRTYLIWTLVGELALFSGLVLASTQLSSMHFVDMAGTSLSYPSIALIVLAFGIKLALPGLHFWMPTSYANAPASAAAVLSGPMFNAGLLGLLRFLPPGQDGLADWAPLLFGLAALATLYGAIAGLLTRCPRRLLGYSSMLKSGALLLGVGLAWQQPETAPVIVAALLLFAMHHLLIKGGLFLGLGLWERNGAHPLLMGGMLLGALGLVGAPLTAGAVLKADYGRVLQGADMDLNLLLGAGAIAGVMLMFRLLYLITQKTATGSSLALPAIFPWLAVSLIAWWFAAGPGLLQDHLAALPGLTIGLLLAVPAYWLSRRLKPLIGRVKGLGPMLRRHFRQLHGRWSTNPVAPPGLPSWRPGATDFDIGLPSAALAWLALTLLLLLLLIYTG